MSHPKTILLVDDDQDILLVLQDLLVGEGYTVQIANSGTAAIRSLQQGLPDLILLDILIAGTDGRKFAKQLKEEARTATIPLLMISAHPNGGQEAHAAGADDFVAKPFEIDTLLAKVAHALE
jgi:CheY-like chemotaxis protein